MNCINKHANSCFKRKAADLLASMTANDIINLEVLRDTNLTLFSKGMIRSLQGWAIEWSLGLQFFYSCMLRHRLSAGCVATKLNKKSPNLGATL